MLKEPVAAQVQAEVLARGQVVAQAQVQAVELVAARAQEAASQILPP